MIFCPVSGLDATITQNFGERPQFYAQYGLKGHDGTDLRAAVGTPVFAPDEGYLHYANEGSAGYGKYATITSLPYLKDGTSREITLGHLSQFIPGMEGQFVHSKDLIGYSGETGDASGPHVHLGYRKLDANGHVLNYDNGFHGFIDIAHYVEKWALGQNLA